MPLPHLQSEGKATKVDISGYYFAGAEEIDFKGSASFNHETEDTTEDGSRHRPTESNPVEERGSAAEQGSRHRDHHTNIVGAYFAGARKITFHQKSEFSVNRSTGTNSKASAKAKSSADQPRPQATASPSELSLEHAITIGAYREEHVVFEQAASNSEIYGGNKQSRGTVTRALRGDYENLNYTYNQGRSEYPRHTSDHHDFLPAPTSSSRLQGHDVPALPPRYLSPQAREHANSSSRAFNVSQYKNRGSSSRSTSNRRGYPSH